MKADTATYMQGDDELFRQKVHEQADMWVDKLLAVSAKNTHPTLMELSELFNQTRQELLGSCFESLIEHKYEDLLTMDYCQCPDCGKRCKCRRQAPKKIITMHGSVKLNRPWFYCTGCLSGFSPLDTALELSSRKYQFDIQKKAVNLAADVTFQRTSDIFEDLTGIAISDHCVHEIFDSIGSAVSLEDTLPSREDIEQKIEQASTAGSWRPILVVASDGAFLPTRPKAGRSDKRGKGKWQDAKGFRFYLLDENRIIQLVSWHQIQNEAEFGEHLKIAASRIPQRSVRIALIGDGAGWLWKHMTACFPNGREILDYYHCSEHIHKVAKIQYGEKTPKAFEWAEATIARLFFNEIDSVTWGLQRMKPSNNEAKEEIRKLIGYLKNNNNKIHYHGDRIGGYPIGSGGIESANKFICHTRMKRSGAWWVKETGNEMLRIRCAIFNGTYDKVFENYKRGCLANH